MSNAIEFAPFPEDTILQDNIHFCDMVGQWQVHLEFDLYETDPEASEEEKWTTEDVREELLEKAREFFPELNPYHVITKALWTACNQFQEQSRIDAEGDERWHI